jgi:hypothetical protein
VRRKQSIEAPLFVANQTHASVERKRATDIIINLIIGQDFKASTEGTRAGTLGRKGEFMA